MQIVSISGMRQYDGLFFEWVGPILPGRKNKLNSDGK